MENEKITAREKELIEEIEKLKAEKEIVKDILNSIAEILGETETILARFRDLVIEETSQERRQ